jgi:hypothetical protein
MSAATGNTGIAVPDEAPVETVENRIIDDMMHDPVPEISRPDFPDFRMRHDKSDASPDFVIPAFKVVIQPDQIALQIGLEPQLVNRIALAPAAIEIGVEHRQRQVSIHRHELLYPLKEVRERGFNSGNSYQTRRTGSRLFLLLLFWFPSSKYCTRALLLL